MKSYIVVLLLSLIGVCTLQGAEVVTTEPSPLQISSHDVVIYFHADQGTKGLIGSAASAELYAHTGVITDKSKNDTDWRYASDWKKNESKYRLEYVSANLWKLKIGDIRSFYGIPEGETPSKLAFVFRNADGSKEGKGTGGKDIFVNVEEEGYRITLSSDIEGNVVSASHTTVRFKITATESSTLSLSVNGTLVKSADNVTALEVPYTFTNYGNYTVSAKGVHAQDVHTVESVYCYPQASVAKDYPGGKPRQGAVRNTDGTVTFCLAAPGKNSVILIPSWDNYQAQQKNVMNYQDYEGQRYFWVNVSGLDADKAYLYYYLIDGSIKVADPYARLILDPYNDKYISESVYPNMPAYPAALDNVVLAVYHENINKYNWSVKDFKGVRQQDLVIYELLLRDFTGTEGKAEGNGSLRQAIEKLPYLKELGVNAIELLPINEFNGNNSWGYNPNFYFAPDKAYGTPDDYKEFIDLCHKNGIAVILDIVFNQSDGLHPWYQMYEVGSNPFYNKTAPHAYSVLNDWNQDHPLVMQQWKDCVKYWVEEYKVDGYRFDLVKGLGDNNSYGSGTEAYNASRVARMKQIHSALKEVKPDAYFINENLAGAKEENEMAEGGQLNWANINNASCQYAMGFSSDCNLNRFNAERDSRIWGSTVSYAESHDEERMGYKQKMFGADGVKGNNEVSKRRIGSLHAQMILSPGAHMIWQFSELGNDQTTKEANGGNNTSPKIVNWSVLDDDDTYGLYENVRDLIHVRTHNPELFEQDAIKQMNFAASSWQNGRFLYCSKNGKELMLAVNPNVVGDRTFECSTMFASKDNSSYKIASASYNTTPEFNASTGRISVPANSYVLIVSNDVSGIKNIEAVTTAGNEVYSIGGNIIVNGEYNLLEVYNASGMRMPVSGLTPGIYVVRVDNKAYKVAVR